MHHTRIGLNGREFTVDEFHRLIVPRLGEKLGDQAARIAHAIGVGCVISYREDEPCPVTVEDDYDTMDSGIKL